MHSMIVNAHGVPGSFSRRVQLNPAVAVEVRRMLQRLADKVRYACDLQEQMSRSDWDELAHLQSEADALLSETK